MSDTDPFDALRTNKPFPADHVTVDSEAKTALFEEITMSETNTMTQRRATMATRNRPAWRRPTLAAAAATIAAVGIFSTTLDNQSAYAAVIEATEVVADADSGNVRVKIDLHESTVDGETESGSIIVDYRYVGRDSHTVLSGSIFVDGIAEMDDLQMEVIRVDDTSYLSDPDGTWFEIEDFGSQDVEIIPGLGTTGTDPEAMLELLRTAENMTRASNADGTTTYVGTITAAAIEAIGPDGLPAGVAMIADGSGNLPPEVELTVTVSDDALRSVRLDAVGEYPGNENNPAGFIDASILTTYSEIGAVSSIEPPAPDLILETPAIDESLLENIQIFGDFIEANPDVCASEMVPLDNAATSEDMAIALDEVSICFDRKAPPEVAVAWRALNAGIFDGPGDN